MDTILVASAPLVARREELDLLSQRLEDTMRGTGSLVLIGGTAGLGKTSLAAALLRLAQEKGAAVAVGRFYEGTAPPFGVWQDLLADLVTDADVEPSGLSEPFDVSASIHTTYQLMQSVVSNVRAIARSRPSVIVLDDLHWADTDSLELLDLATRRLDGVPLLIIGTYRVEDVHRRHPLYDVLPTLQRDRPVERITLTSLMRDDVSALATARWGACAPQLVDYLHGRSEGNPFFLIEIMRDLIERHLLMQDERGQWLPPLWRGSVPVMLQQVINRRIARLGDDAGTMLRVAAVVGEQWELALIEAVLGWTEDRLLGALEISLEAALVAPFAESTDVFRFAHSLMRNVLYEEQVARRRRSLHRRVAEVMERHRGSNALIRDCRRASSSLCHGCLRRGDLYQRAGLCRRPDCNLDRGQAGAASRRATYAGELGRGYTNLQHP